MVTTTIIIILAAGLVFSIGAASNVGMQSQATAQQQSEEIIGYKRLQCQVQLL